MDIMELIVNKRRECTMCKKAKPAGAFTPDSRVSSGLQARCRECKRTLDKVRNQTPEARQSATESRKKWRKRNHGLGNFCDNPVSLRKATAYLEGQVDE